MLRLLGKEIEEPSKGSQDNSQERQAEGNIFSFIIHQKTKWKTGLVPLDRRGGATFAKLCREKPRVSRALIFSTGHVWALRRVGGVWYELNSTILGDPVSLPSDTFPLHCGYLYVDETLPEK